MKIVIDGRMYNESGIGRYIRNLIASLAKLDHKNEYYILLLKEQYDTLVYHSNFHKVLANFKWYGVNEQINLPKLLDSLQPDLVHFPHFNVPIFNKHKFIVTIHDLIHQHFQMRRATTLNPVTYKIKQFAYKKVFKNAISKAEKILVPSNYVKQLLVSEWKIAEDKVAVTYEAVDGIIFAIANIMREKKINQVIKKFNVKPPYIFYVGNAHPHKNVEGLIEAFLKLRERYQYLQLVLSGNDHYFWQKVKSMYSQKDIIYTGYVTDEDLVALYKNAQSFIMPSFEEGFGIPILEAFTCDCAVVSSNKGSLPEVGGEAAIYFDPSDMEDMVAKIDIVLKSQKLRQDLVNKGKKRVKLFNWEKLAKQTLEAYL